MLRTASLEVKKYIPLCERDEKQPTTICYKSLSKGDYEKLSSSLVEFKKGKFVNRSDKAYETLLRFTLAKDEAGVYIHNASVDGVAHPVVTDMEVAVKFMLGLEDLGTANEIEAVLRGASTLNEDEIKNSDGSSDAG